MTVSGVAVWFNDWPGEILDLPDVDVEDAASVVGKLVSFWFILDEVSGGIPPLIYESASDDITDSLGTSYFVESQGLPAALGTGKVKTVPSVALANSTSVEPMPAISSSGSAPRKLPNLRAAQPLPRLLRQPPLIPSADDMRVQVLNGSGIFSRRRESH